MLCDWIKTVCATVCVVPNWSTVKRWHSTLVCYSVELRLITRKIFFGISSSYTRHFRFHSLFVSHVLFAMHSLHTFLASGSKYNSYICICIQIHMRSQINDLYEFYPNAFRLEHTYHYIWYGCVVTPVTASGTGAAGWYNLLLFLSLLLLLLMLLLPLPLTFIYNQVATASLRIVPFMVWIMY